MKIKNRYFQYRDSEPLYFKVIGLFKDEQGYIRVCTIWNESRGLLKLGNCILYSNVNKVCNLCQESKHSAGCDFLIKFNRFMKEGSIKPISVLKGKLLVGD